MTTQQIEEQDFHPATTAEWHNQWHFENIDAKSTCPWDCGRNEDPNSEPEGEWFTVKCGHCHLVHGAPDWTQMRRSIRECAKR